MEKLKQTGKRIFTFLMALALIVTSFTIPTQKVYAAKTKKADTVKTVDLKFGKKKVTKKTVTLYLGEEQKLTVSVSPAKAKKTVSIKSDKSSVVSVNKKGILKAKKEGKAKISVKVKSKNKTKSTYINVKVKKSFSLASKNVTMQTGATKLIKAKTAAYHTIKWTTSNKEVATVKGGRINAVAPGKAKITAKIGKVSAVVNVKVTKQTAVVEIKKISLDKTEATLKTGEIMKLIPTIEPKNASELLLWKSDHPEIASVSKEGEVKGIAEGVAVISATSPTGVSATCKVTVSRQAEMKNGLDIQVKNELKQYSSAGKSVVMMGNDTAVSVRLVQNGNPVNNADIKLTMEEQYGNAEKYYAISGKETISYKTTAKDGYVTFPISLVAEHSDAKAMDGKYISYKLTASYQPANGNGASEALTASTALCFATVVYNTDQGKNHLFVANQYDENLPKIETSTNAAKEDQGIAVTKSKNGEYDVEYVTSQQVSSEKKPHAVTMKVIPEILIPAAEVDKETGDYLQEIDWKSGSYSVYNDEKNESTTKIIESIPAGLEWARIYFDKITISQYTKLQIKFYDKKTKKQISDTVEINVDSFNEDSKTVQVPVQPDRDVYAEIALISAGQVDEGSNDGYTVARVAGQWSSAAKDIYKFETLSDKVSWSRDDKFFVRSTSETLTYDQAKAYLPSGSKYLSEKNTYSCRVPAFPSVGNAVIDVKDANKKTIATFLYPAENLLVDQVYQNKNVIAAASSKIKAINASSAEVENKVGDVKTDGCSVTVDSTLAGYTPLKAAIDLSALGISDQIELYTNIQWSPVTNDDDKPDAQDFYAVKGQQVEVTAQLYDSNNNKVAQEGKEIVFYQGEKTRLKSFGFDGKSPSTDKQGQCKITLKNPSEAALYLEELNAKAESYKVRLTIGTQKEEVELANIHWVDLGLYFCNDVLDDDEKSKDQNAYLITEHTKHPNVVETRVFTGNKVLGQYKNGNVTAVGTETATGTQISLARNVGSQWIFGMPVVGRLDDGTGDIVTKVSGVNVQFTKAGVGDKKDENQEKGIYTLASTEKGDSLVTGKVDQKSLTDGVTFTVFDAKDQKEYTYPNVGTGACGVSASIGLVVNWDPSGMVLDTISPMGDQLDVTTATKVYFSLKDSFGNALSGQDVSYSIESTELPELVKKGKAKTNEKGIAEISLKAPGKTGTITIKSNYDGDNAVSTKTINYVASGMTAGFSANKASLLRETTPYTITVEFSTAVRKDSVRKELFKIYKKDSAKKDDYKISSVVVPDGQDNQVVLTLDGEGLKDVNVEDIRVGINSYKDADGIEYQLTDTYNRTLSAGGELAVEIKK